jgi:hypothetical protein
VLLDLFVLGTGMTRKGFHCAASPALILQPTPGSNTQTITPSVRSHPNALAHPQVSWAPFATDADSTPAFYPETPVCKCFNDQLLFQRLNVRQNVSDGDLSPPFELVSQANEGSIHETAWMCPTRICRVQWASPDGGHSDAEQKVNESEGSAYSSLANLIGLGQACVEFWDLYASV